MRNVLVSIVFAFVLLGITGTTDAQQVRSTTHRSNYTSHGRSYHHHRYSAPRYSYGHTGVRWGVHVGYGGYYGGYYGPGWGGYPGYTNYRSASIYVAPPQQVRPRFIHYPARCPAPCLPAPIVIQQAPAPTAPTETVGLKEGEVRKIGEVVVANVNGKIVIYQAE